MRHAYQRHEEALVAVLGTPNASNLIDMLQRAIAAAQSISSR